MNSTTASKLVDELRMLLISAEGIRGRIIGVSAKRGHFRTWFAVRGSEILDLPADGIEVTGSGLNLTEYLTKQNSSWFTLSGSGSKSRHVIEDVLSCLRDGNTSVADAMYRKLDPTWWPQKDFERAKVAIERDRLKKEQKQVKGEVVALIAKERYDDATAQYKLACKEWWSEQEFEREIVIAKQTANARKQAQDQRRLEAIDRAERERLQLELQARQYQWRHHLEKVMHDDFLAVDGLYSENNDDLLTDAQFRKLKSHFVRAWVERYLSVADGVKRDLPDDEQCAAIGSVTCNVQVVARAGSGKTATMVNRAWFLIRHCRVPPSQILLLAFNRKAAQELRRRLLARLDAEAEKEVAALIERHHEKSKNRRRKFNAVDIETRIVGSVARKRKVGIPLALTFHALGAAIVQHQGNILVNATDASSQELSRAFQNVIDDHLSQPAYADRIRDLMLAHFREDWERIQRGGFDKSQEELLHHLRTLPRQCLQKHAVKSLGEKLIGDFLFEYGIPYGYEWNHRWNGINYRPDFTIPLNQKGKGIVIEYFGMCGDPDYDEMSDKKREYWATTNDDWKFLEYSPEDIICAGKANFLVRLKQDVDQARGIVSRRLSEDEIWRKVKERAIDDFTNAMKAVISRCRKLCWSPDELQHKAANHPAISAVESEFLALAVVLYRAYLGRSTATGDEDFDGLLQKAAEKVTAGITVAERASWRVDLATIRYLCIDEFQDFSELFHRLVMAIRQHNADLELFCVGDDWQAINGFAGSDLKFFDDFATHLGQAQRLELLTNYRSGGRIVDAGNALMKGQGSPARPKSGAEAGSVVLADLAAFEPNYLERARHGSNADLVCAVLRLIASTLQQTTSDVVMLCRTNYVPASVPDKSNDLYKFLVYIRRHFPAEMHARVSIETAHRYKGLEQSVVILLDVLDRRYPLIHPNWIFNRVFGESVPLLEAAERRLFYVALTRASQKLILVTDRGKKSRFLTEMEKSSTVQISAVDWSAYPPPMVVADAQVLVEVKNRDGVWLPANAGTQAISQTLLASGYQYRTTGEYDWKKALPSQGFDINILKSEPWPHVADQVDVHVRNGANQEIARYRIDGGQWQCVFDRIEN